VVKVVKLFASIALIGVLVFAGLVNMPSVDNARAVSGEWDAEWSMDFAYELESVVAASDGGYIVVGDDYIAKFDSGGALKWYQCGFYINFYSVALAPNSGYIAVGGEYSDAGIVRFDSDGALEWRSSFGGTGLDVFYSGVPTLDGGYIAVGFSNSIDGDLTGLNKGSRDAIIVKYDSDGALEWNKNFGGSDLDLFDSVASTPDGGYIAVGRSKSDDGDLTGLSNGYDDAVIVKYNSDGEIEWNRNFGGSDEDRFMSVTLASGGGYVVAGYSSSDDGDLAGLNRDGDDAIIVEYSSNGTLVWNKSFGGSDSDIFHSVISTSDGGYIAVGSSSSYDGDLNGLNDGNWDAIIVKFGTNGTLEWAKSFGGGNNSEFYSVAPTIDGGYIAVGGSQDWWYSYDYPHGWHVDYNGIIAKYSRDDMLQWNKNFGGKNDDWFYSVASTPDGGYIAVGCSYPDDDDDDDDDDLDLAILKLNNGSCDAIIVKYSSDGTLEWNKNFGGSDEDRFISVTLASGGGYVVAGYSYSTNGDLTGLNKGNYDAIIAKYSSTGTLEWNKNFGGSDSDGFNSIAPTPDGGYIAAGWSSSTNGDLTGLNNGNLDAIIVKFSANGALEWAKNFGGSEYDSFNSVALTPDGGYIVAGCSYSTDGDLAGLDMNEMDAIIIKYNSNGTLEWSKKFGGKGYDGFNSVAVTPDGYVAVGSDSSKGFVIKGDAIIVKYNFDGVIQWNKKFGGSGYDGFESVAVTLDGGYIVAGYSNSTNGRLARLNKGWYDAIIVKYMDPPSPKPDSTSTTNAWKNNHSHYNKKDKKPLTLIIDHDCTDLEVEVNGQFLVRDKDYTVTCTDDGTEITLTPEYLYTLPDDDYSIRVSFDDGTTVNNTFTVVNPTNITAPNTGLNITQIGGLSIVSLLAVSIVGMLVRRIVRGVKR